MTIKTQPGTDGDRRVSGVLQTTNREGVVVRAADGSVRSIRHDEILKARTVFTWTPEPKSARKGHDRDGSADSGRKVGS